MDFFSQERYEMKYYRYVTIFCQIWKESKSKTKKQPVKKGIYLHLVHKTTQQSKTVSHRFNYQHH